METLQFTQDGDGYSVEFTANADYALHVERQEGGFLAIYQRSSDTGEYARCMIPSGLLNAKVIDYAFSHGVYPMHVKIFSETNVTIATRNEVTTA